MRDRLVPMVEEWGPGYHKYTVGRDPKDSTIAEMRHALAGTVATLRLLAHEEFERAMRPCLHCQPQVVSPVTRDLAERLAAYLETVPGGRDDLDAAMARVQPRS